MTPAEIILITRLLIEGAKLTAAAFELLDKAREGEKITKEEVMEKRKEINSVVLEWLDIVNDDGDI